MSIPSIQIRIIRDNTNSLKDEIFTITQGSHNDWRLNHKSNFSQSNSTMFAKSRSDVLEYLENIFDLLKIDDEPFQFLQFDIPCCPVTMVPRSDALMRTNTLNKLVQVVEYTLHNWPCRVDEWSA